MKNTISKISEFMYSIPRILFINFYRLFIRIRIINKKGLPQGKPAIFAINHSTDADPVIILGAFKKKIYFFSEGEDYDSRFINFFMRRFANSTPVFKKQVKKNIGSFRDYFSISKKKNVFFGIFPEGLVNKKADFSKFYKGTAYFSYKTKIPIVPVYLHNTNKGPDSEKWIFTNIITRSLISLTINAFRKIYVFIGNPVDPVAENIERDCIEMTSPKTYRYIVDEIHETLKKEFSELKNKACFLFEAAEDDFNILNDMEDLSEDAAWEKLT